jgi:hypothetical protein
MTTTELQKWINFDPDGAKTHLADIVVFSPDPNQEEIFTSELMEATVESVVATADLTLQNEHANSIISFAFPEADGAIECFRDGGQIVCRKAQTYRF